MTVNGGQEKVLSIVSMTFSRRYPQTAGILFGLLLKCDYKIFYKTRPFQIVISISCSLQFSKYIDPPLKNKKNKKNKIKK
jgi:hypothetical protein